MKPLTIFYLLFAYVVLQFLWWGYHMRDLNSQIADLKNEVNEVKITNYEEVDSKRKNLMIIGEGTVFLVLISLGAWRVNKSYNHEKNLNKLQQNFLLAVTHELKSPLASIKVSLQTAKHPKVDTKKRIKLGDNALIDVNRLDNLVDNILIASKLENKYYNYYKEEVNISKLLYVAVNNIEKRHNMKHVFNMDVKHDLVVIGDTIAINFVISNLLENAVKYSPDAKSIDISLSLSQNKTRLQIKDQGVGIPDSDKKNIFKKFYRIGDENTRKTKGTGLGLYIVKEVINFHKASIDVKDNTPNGTIFEINFTNDLN